ncbi:ubiquitin-like activating enzyme [Penicillium argentinense]|uniref:Ubiquitin-activating enzyme E1-like n=1 Tax=Penicillium argentinense TaxID=1131581 RepID=A0A9W9FDA4_9EURO|nr:ubiquitin-like activating enzyme [Penicillium argentinense]KAJ5097975.1 ubiquitin-like activating enzyme [Penicillium argentinense]
MRPSSIKRSVGVDLAHRIQKSRVLLVGAGGIGCELLKNLVLTGFGEVHIIDLDTIDLSNLNRQFLFRHEHIKKPKALVAKEVAQKFQPSAKLEAYHANIMDHQFNVDWFAGFNIVFNALDNISARRHVNHMCLAAGVPLIESGTTGFNGQVQVIEKGKTECYDCNEKETPKTYPICTLRSNPTQPIHCIVWAKSWLIPELFGESEDESGTIDSTEDAENADEIQKLREEALALKEIRESMGSDDFCRKVFEKVFKVDIERLRGMEDMWKERQPPDALEYDSIEQDPALSSPAASKEDRREWTLKENFLVFKDSLDRLSKRLKELVEKATSSDPKPQLLFDKDDEDTLDFVTAAANLRSIIFHIPQKTKFDTKQMAGNIIPAIATTNAMTAGLCVLQSFKVLQDDLSQAKMVFLERSGARAINSDSLDPPKPGCSICSSAHGRVAADQERATLGDLVEILRSDLEYGEELSIVNSAGQVIYDPDLEENLTRKLSEPAITNGFSFLTIRDEDDQDQDPRVNLDLFFVERQEPASEDSKPVTLQGTLEIPRKPKKKNTEPVFEDASTANGTSGLGKRKRDGEDEVMTNGHVAKKVAGEQANGDSDDLIVLDEEDSGAILIDD